LSFAHGGKLLASSWDEDPSASTWAQAGDGADFGLKARYRGSAPPGTDRTSFPAVAWSPSSENVIATGARDGSVRIWDGQTGIDTYVLDKRHTGRVLSVAWDAAGIFLASGSADGTVHVWAPGAQRGPLRSLPTTGGAASALAWLSSDQNGGSVAVGAEDGRILRWDTRTGAMDRLVQAGGKEILSLAWSSKNGALASGSQDGSVHVWLRSSAENLRLDSVHQGAVAGLAWSADERLLASASDEGTVKLWNWTGRGATLVGEIVDDRSGVLALAWADDDVLAIGRQDHIELVLVTL
jgi:WD40 repeat protein